MAYVITITEEIDDSTLTPEQAAQAVIDAIKSGEQVGIDVQDAATGASVTVFIPSE